MQEASGEDLSTAEPGAARSYFHRRSTPLLCCCTADALGTNKFFDVAFIFACGAKNAAGFPSLPSSLLQGSSFVGSLVDSFLHTNLGAEDLAAERIAMHPLASRVKRGLQEETQEDGAGTLVVVVVAFTFSGSNPYPPLLCLLMSKHVGTYP